MFIKLGCCEISRLYIRETESVIWLVFLFKNKERKHLEQMGGSIWKVIGQTMNQLQQKDIQEGSRTMFTGGKAFSFIFI